MATGVVFISGYSKDAFPPAGLRRAGPTWRPCGGRCGGEDVLEVGGWRGAADVFVLPPIARYYVDVLCVSQIPVLFRLNSCKLF